VPRRSATEIRALRADHSLYPASLQDLGDAPEILYTCGALPPRASRAVAIVGSRAASPYGRAMAERLASDLARIGFAVVSGLARGIDAAAHRGAMEAGGQTWAVVPSSLDEVTPRHHEQLAETIAERGGLISEIAEGAPGFRSAFIRRNRLIAALAGVTVVVEAALRSGALSTAAAARRLRRTVLAVPGDVDRATARGCHGLLRTGALLCESAGDVVRAIEAWRRARGEADDEEDSAESRLWSSLGSEPESLEALALRAGVELPRAMAALLSLQWAGAAEQHPGQRWARVDR